MIRVDGQGSRRHSPRAFGPSFVAGAAIAVWLVLAGPARSTPAPEAVDAVGEEDSVGAVDPAARLLAGGSAGEAWDVLARLDDGSLFSARFWITNEGPGTHTGVAMGYYLRPDGSVSRFRYGRTRDRWQLAASGRYLKIASAVLDLRAPSGSVEIDTEKGGMKLSFRFAMPHAPPPICARRGAQSGFDLIRLQQEAKGRAWVDGMAEPMRVAGTIDVTHAWGATSEIDTVLRRIDASGRKGDVAFFATSVISPSDRANPWSCFAVVENGRWIFESPDATAELSGTTLGGTGDRYPVASRIVWRDGGTTLTIEPQRELLRVEPLDVVPQPFRLLLALRSSPRRIWAETRGHLRLSQRASGESLDLSTVGTVAIGYTNPW